MNKWLSIPGSCWCLRITWMHRKCRLQEERQSRRPQQGGCWVCPNLFWTQHSHTCKLCRKVVSVMHHIKLNYVLAYVTCLRVWNYAYDNIYVYVKCVLACAYDQIFKKPSGRKNKVIHKYCPISWCTSTRHWHPYSGIQYTWDHSHKYIQVLLLVGS